MFKKYYNKYKQKRVEERNRLNKMIERINSSPYIRSEFTQGEYIEITGTDKSFILMYLYSLLDEDYWLRLDINGIIVLKQSLISKKVV